MKQAHEGIIYDTDTAKLLAHNEPSDILEQTKTSLYRTINGRYFTFTEATYLTNSKSECSITPLDTPAALNEYNKLTVRIYDFEEAFPDVEFKEA